MRVVRALRVCGPRQPLLLGTCPCAFVVAGSVPLWRASWPRVVRRASSGPVALGAPIGFPDAVVPFPTPGAWAPGFTGRLRGARGGRQRTGLIVPAAGPRRGRDDWLAPRRTRSRPRDGDCPWRVPPAPVLGCVRCGGWRVWTWSLTRPVSCTVRRSTGHSAGAPGLFHVDSDTSPCGSEDATPGSRACVRVLVLPGRVGQAGLPGAFWCASPFPLAALSFRFAWPPPGWGCPCLVLCLPSPPRFCFCFVVVFCLSVLFCLDPTLSLAFLGFLPQMPWALALCVVCFAGLVLLGPPCALPFFVLPCRGPLSGGCPLPPSPSLAVVAVPSCLALVFFSFPFSPLVRALLVSGFLCFLAPLPWALALVCVCRALLSVLFVFFLPPASGFFVRSRLFCVSWLAGGCSPLVVAPPPSPSVSRGFCRSRSAPWFFLSPLLCAPVVSGFFWFAARGALSLGAVFCLFFSASRCPALRALLPRVFCSKKRAPLAQPPPPALAVVQPRFNRRSAVQPRPFRVQPG